MTIRETNTAHIAVAAVADPIFVTAQRRLCLQAVLVAAGVLLLAGCARWRAQPQPAAQLPAPRMSPDSVVLEVAVVHVAPELRDVAAALWDEVDEQHLPADLRRRLHENGIRCGLVGQVPEGLRQILQADREEVKDGLEAAARRTRQGTWRERIQNRSGEKHQIVTTPVRQRMDVFIKEDDAIRGRTCYQAHCELALQTFPQGDGSVRLKLTPEIHHGPPRQRYVGDSYAFILQSRQDRLVLEHLEIETALLPGQMLILSATPEITGVGRQFFADPDAENPVPRLVLIRLAQTQYDDLFDPGRILAPIATPTDE